MTIKFHNLRPNDRIRASNEKEVYEYFCGTRRNNGSTRELRRNIKAALKTGRLAPDSGDLEFYIYTPTMQSEPKPHLPGERERNRRWINTGPIRIAA